jgi:hypothetical protein
MSNTDNNRVLSRMGARKVSQVELDEVSAGIVPTLLSFIVTNNGQDHSLDS